MLALVAAICFALAFFGVAPGGYSLVVLGLLFVALHLVFAIPLPFRARV